VTTDQWAETEIRACRSCGRPIYWGVTATGKRCPYDVVDGVATTVSHFATCPDANSWRKSR
jgi:hypothetical protein